MYFVNNMVKLSRSKLELFWECPRCFWLDIKQKIKRPQPPPYTINNAVDYLLKQEFDVYREKGKPHPIMVRHKIDAVPYKSKEIQRWRQNFTGVEYHHEPTGYLVHGAVDDVWVNPKGELMVVDYKATGAREHQIYDSYKRQMEVYQWLLRQNGFRVSDIGYFVFARVNKGNGFSVEGGSASGGGNGEALLPFDLFIEAHKGDDAWVEKTIKASRRVYESEEAPQSSADCKYCLYREGAQQAA